MFVSIEKKHEVGRLLTLLRKNTGLTQRQVADGSGVLKSQVSAYEKGKSLPSLPAFCKLMKFFGYRIVLEKEKGNERK